jgi:chemotaxis protein methyltransferase CheR
MNQISPDDFDFLSRLLHRHVAIVIGEDKRYLLDARLRDLLRDEELQSVSDLVAELRANRSRELTRRVIERLTTNETFFFRDTHAFDALREHIVPELLDHRRQARALNIWSAACSSGQEPYSIAMMLRRHFASPLGLWDVRILATDYNTEMVERARTGCFNQVEINRGLPTPLLLDHFRRKGAQWEIEPSIRRMVEFDSLNLVEQWPEMGQMDLILLRNVLIYFDDDTRRAVLQRVRRHIADDGFLVLGSCETSMDVGSEWIADTWGKMIVYRPRIKEVTEPHRCNQRLPQKRHRATQRRHQ